MRCRVIVDCIVLLALLIMATESPAGDLDEYEIRIDRQPLATAMTKLARQAYVSIVSYETGLSQIMVGPVVGTFTPGDALQRLLAGTGFIVSVREPGSYEIYPAAVIRGPALPTAGPMTVYGSRLAAMNAPPLRTFDARTLDQFGVSTLGELLNYSLVQPYALPETAWGNGAQYADLRGFGMDMGAVLINGRWVLPSATSSGLAFDLNTIPLTAVERVTVLDDSAAAAIGVRAIGGVVNIELKRTRRWPTARIEYGAAAGGGAQRQLSLGAGSEGERLTSTLSVDYFERSELPGETREFWRDQDFRRFSGGSDWRSTASWPGNISSISGAPLPGLSSSYAAVPLGMADGDPAIGDFQSTAGQYRLESLRRFSSIVPAARRLSVAANAEHTFQNVTAFVELLGVRRLTEYRFMPPILTRALVPTTNAFNPFDEPVFVSRLLSDFEPRQVDTNSELLRVVGGLRGELDSWGWELTALKSQEVASHWANNALDPERLANALASSDPDQALNVFQDGPIGSPDLVASLVAEPSTVGYRSIGSEFAATLHGPLLQLPTGEVRASVGAQWRTETTASTRTVAIGHAELQVPLWPEGLEARVSTRSDDFSDIDHMITPSYSLTWRPLESLEVRWSSGTNFRAPTSYELFGPSYSGQMAVPDPRRNGEVGSPTVYVGSSADLQAVTSKSTAMSATIRPQTLPGLEVRGNYWSTRVNNRIMRVPLSLLLEHEAEFAERIVRDPPTPEDSAAGVPGVLRSIDLSMTNVGGIDASGLDVIISYRFKTGVGTFKYDLAATWMDEFATYDVPGAQPTNRVGVADPRGTIPLWRAHLALHWRNRIAGSTVSARYVGPYEDVSGKQRTGRQLGSQTLVDLQGWLELGELAPSIALLRGVRTTAGALNVFDTSPQFATMGQDLGYDPSSSDPRQRFGYLRIEKRF